MNATASYKNKLCFRSVPPENLGWKKTYGKITSRLGHTQAFGPFFHFFDRATDLCAALNERILPTSQFDPLHTPSGTPNALCHPVLVDVVHRVRGRPRVTPRNWVTTAQWYKRRSKLAKNLKCWILASSIDMESDSWCAYRFDGQELLYYHRRRFDNQSI